MQGQIAVGRQAIVEMNDDSGGDDRLTVRDVFPKRPTYR
jgi:hypothetical protein